MDDPSPDFDAPAKQPDLFVARDRARNFARRLKDTRQERRLAYLGAEVGMASLINEAEGALVKMIDEAAQTVDDIVHQRIRDRERSYTEMPLAVVAESIGAQAELARQIDRAVRSKKVDVAKGQQAALDLMQAALDRIDAFCDAYDDKQPIGPPRPMVLSHLLESVERQAVWAQRIVFGRASGGPPYDRLPPDIVSEPHGLADVLHAARGAVVAAVAPWRIAVSNEEHSITLAIGATEGVEIEAPDRLLRAVEVLRFRHPIEVHCIGSVEAASGLLTEKAEAIEKVTGIRVVVPRPGKPKRVRAAEDEGEVLDPKAILGADGVLTPEAEKAVGALEMAEAISGSSCPPGRAVAWMGLFRVLDGMLKTLVAGRCRSHPCQSSARRLPRDKTRKAPLQAVVVQTLMSQFLDFPEERINPVADLLAQGKADSRLGKPEDAAVVIAMLGRHWRAANVDMRPVLVLAPLSENDVNALIAELCTIAVARRMLEGGISFDASAAHDLERALISALGRLGRVAA